MITYIPINTFWLLAAPPSVGYIRIHWRSDHGPNCRAMTCYAWTIWLREGPGWDPLLPADLPALFCT